MTYGQMKKVALFILSPWLISLIGVILLSVLVWFYGPVVTIDDWRPFQSELSRVITIICLFVLWVLFVIVMALIRRRRNAKMVDEIAESEPEEETDLVGEMGREEVALLKGRLQESLNLLKKAKLGGKRGRQYLYQLPWYIIIGPPGAGKTTALVNSGLRFPLADSLGKDPVGGTGGTRNCDWWFTDEAVLIDTAGRYTTQDSDSLTDSSAWSGFLGLLRKYRKRQPINGALVAISLADLATLPEGERKANAQAIRKRIKELNDELGIRVPIYVVFTKSDLIAGFAEFFDNLGREARAQVWGMTFPLEKLEKGKGGHPVERFDAEFGLLVDQLNEIVLERLQQETDMERRSLIYGFPLQFNSFKNTAREFLTEIFQPTGYEQPALLRGVYFTSGTQDGTPIDRLMGTMAKTFGIGRQAISAASGTGKSFFITQLLTDVIFSEAGVVGRNLKLERRITWLRRLGTAALVLLVCGAIAAWVVSYLENQTLIAQSEEEVQAYLEEVGKLDLQEVKNSNALAVLPALNRLRDMPGGPADEANGVDPPLSMTFGLYQGGKIGAQARSAYRRALNGLFLPRLLLRLEEQMAANITNEEFLYQALKIYLMLGLQGPLDADFVKQWMSLDWRLALRGESADAVRADLEGHLDELLDEPMREIALNGPLVEQVRAILGRIPLAERAYTIVQQLPEARDLERWRLLDHAGPAATRVFIRPSGLPLSDGVEGLYTYDGFNNVFLEALADVTESVAAESWVLGTTGNVEFSDQQLGLLARDVLGLYLDDYATRWDQLLADVAIVEFQSVTHAAEVMNTLAGPNSPLKNFLEAVAKETKLTAPPPQAAIDNATGGIGDVLITEIKEEWSNSARKISGVLEKAVAERLGEEPPPHPGQYIDDRFANLHAYVGEGGDAPSELKALLATLADLYREVNAMAGSGNANNAALSAAASGGAGAASRLQLAANTAPAPVQAWVGDLTGASSTITAGGARAQINNDWKANVLPFCRQALGNRYPVFKDGKADVTLGDFGKLFGPGGLIDAFMQKNLLPFVDTTARTWRWQRVDNVDLGLSTAALAQFQRAAEIRDSFFGIGGQQPGIQFEMVPIALDASSTQVLLDVEGQQLSYNHGPPRPQAMAWPNPQGTRQVRLSFQPTVTGQASGITFTGPWGLFRLLDQADIKTGGLSDRFNVTFQVGVRQATFELRAQSVINPFALPALGRFRCPAAL
jgi:type VI secretion system protein ImpL